MCRVELLGVSVKPSRRARVRERADTVKEEEAGGSITARVLGAAGMESRGVHRTHLERAAARAPSGLKAAAGEAEPSSDTRVLLASPVCAVLCHGCELLPAPMQRPVRP